MKRHTGLLLISLGLLLGLSPSITTFTAPNHPANGLQSVIAHADDTANASGTITLDGTKTNVPWTLANGVLTLKGGTLDDSPQKSPTPKAPQGRLLLLLAQSMSGSATAAEKYQFLQDSITSLTISSKLVVFPNASYLFAYFPNLTSFSGLDNIDVTGVNDSKGLLISSGLQNMFSNNPKLISFISPKFTDAYQHSMYSFLSDDPALVYADFSQFDGQVASSFQNFVANDASLKTLNLAIQEVSMSQFSTGNAFTGADNLQNLTLSPQVYLNPTSTFLAASSGLTTPPTTADFKGTWQAVGSGNVSFTDNDPLSNDYHSYNPQGTAGLSATDLATLYHPSKFTTNETYVWEPTDSYRAAHTLPDPTPTPTPAPNASTSIDKTDDTTGFTTFKVIATKRIGLYSHKTFTAANRLAWFAQKPQMKQPTFTVIGTATSKAGHARYQVRDTNRHSATYGQTGYMTANSAYVTHTYYASAPQIVTVINPGGINGYTSAPLSQPQTHYKQGTPLTVKKVVTQGATTRFLLRDDHYISANKHLVTAGNQTIPTKVRAKTALNRYDTANLTRRNHHYAKKSHHVFKVLGWDYSHGNSTTTTGTLRYRIAGGYISANHALVALLP